MKLNEWQDAKGNKINTTVSNTTTPATSSKTSSGYKERFEKLLDYHIAHKDKDVDKIIRKEIKNYAFHYTEHHAGGIGGYTKDVTASIGKDGNWDFYVFIDGKGIAHKQGKGWDTFVWEISFYLNLPEVTTDPEYQDLLEWTDKNGKKVNLTTTSQPSSTKNYPDQTERYKKLLAQIDSDGLFRRYTVNLLDDRILAMTLGNGVGVKIIFKPYVPCYLVQVDGYDNTCKNYEEVLKLLIIEGIIGDTDLCESLKEWVDKNSNKIILPRASSSVPAANKTSSNNPSDKFRELTDYMKAHVSNEVEKAEVVELDNGGFTYRETRKKFTGLEYVLSITVNWSQFTSNWKYELHMDSRLLEEQYGQGLKELIKHMFSYFNTPRPGSQEYRDILTEATSIADDFREYENLWD